MRTRIITTIAILIATLSPLIADQPATKKAPFGVPADARLFNGKWYRIYLEKITWKRAQAKCRSLGGQLVCVPDAATQGFLADFGKGVELWIGASDEKVEGLWVWDDGTEMKYNAWYPRQPDGALKENFAVLGSNPERRWFDAPERYDTVVGFICEWKDK